MNGSLDWLQTLADGTRARLLAILGGNELSVGELCTTLQLPQSTVSRHLKVLSNDGWLDSRREGTNQLYTVSKLGWTEARDQLWDWLMRQYSSCPTAAQDQARLMQIIAARSRSAAFFSSTAEHWDSVRGDLFGSRLDAWVMAASLPADGVVAELGCGSAPLAHLVSPFVREVIAVDNSSAMLAAARSRLSTTNNVRLEQASLTQLPIQDAQVDIAWLVLVLPYVDQVVDILAESARVLKPGRPLVIVDLLPHDRGAYRQEMGHLRLGVSREEIDVWFEQAGMKLSGYQVLPPDPSANGPALFAAVGRSSGAGLCNFN
jgi:ArsR family transcriptional regulator